MGESLIVGQQLSGQVVGQSNIQTVGEGHVVSHAPGIVDEAADLDYPQRPCQEFGDGNGYLVGGEDVVDVPSAKYSTALGEEWSGTQGTASEGRSPRKARPRKVSAASSTPAEASMTTGVTPRRGCEPRPRCRQHELPEMWARWPDGGPARPRRSQPLRRRPGW